MGGTIETGCVEAKNDDSDNPVIILGAGTTAALVAQHLAENFPVLQVEWGTVSDFPLFNVLSDKRIKNIQRHLKWNRVKAAALLDWSGQIGEFQLRIKLDDGSIKTFWGQAVVIALDCPSGPVELARFSKGLGDSLHSFVNPSNPNPSNPNPPKTGWSNPSESLSILGSIKDHSVIAFILGSGGLEAVAPTYLALDYAYKLRVQDAYSVCIFHGELPLAADRLEELYQAGRSAGVEFYRYQEPLLIDDQGGHKRVVYRDPFLPKHFPPLGIKVDQVVIAEDFLPPLEIRKIVALTGLMVGSDGFLSLEGLPGSSGQTNRPGIYCVGMAHGPARILELWDEIEAVRIDLLVKDMSIKASRDSAKIPLFTPQNVTAGKALGLVAQVDPSRCALCLTCLRLCPHRAIELNECPERIDRGQLYRQTAWIHPLGCLGCGICLAECPAQAINWVDLSAQTANEDLILLLYENGQLYRQGKQNQDSIERGLKKPVFSLLGLACSQSGFLAASSLPLLADDASNSNQLLAEVRVQAVPCAGQIDELMVLQALSAKVDAVLVWPCYPEACHHQYGNLRARHRLRLTERRLEEIGLSERIAVAPLSGLSQSLLLDSITKMVDRLKLPKPVVIKNT